MYLNFIFLPFLLSLLLTGIIRWLALKNNMMDEPNERSSHSIATPRGGGLAIVICFYVVLIVLFMQQLIAFSVFIGLLGLLAIALISFIDDHKHIAARYRLLVHFSAAAWLCYWLGAIPLDAIFIAKSENIFISVILWIISLIYIVWLLNLYNFMDGIDGIASIEAISVISSATLLLLFNDATYKNDWLPIELLLACSMIVFAFLFWNWPPAKIFMGDVGSAFLGVLIAAFSLITANNDSLDFFIWIILLAVFITDATYTLLIRVAQGKKVYEAHCSHSYQILSRRFGHKYVTLAVLLINSVWLLPLAWLGQQHPEFLTLYIITAYLPLLAIAIKIRAGHEV